MIICGTAAGFPEGRKENMNIRICSRDEVEKLLAGGFPQKTAVISFYDPPSKRTGKPNAPVEYSERAERVFYIPLYDLDVDILEEYGLTFPFGLDIWGWSWWWS